MYIIKSGDLYFDGSGFTSQQRDAKRLAMDSPTPTFQAYLGLVFDNARFVKLRRPNRASLLDSAYSDGFDDGFDAATGDVPDDDWGF